MLMHRLVGEWPRFHMLVLYNSHFAVQDEHCHCRRFTCKLGQALVELSPVMCDFRALSFHPSLIDLRLLADSTNGSLLNSHVGPNGQNISHIYYCNESVGPKRIHTFVRLA